MTQDWETSKFDLSLYLAESADGLVGSLRCALDLFDPSVAETMATQFQRLVDCIIANPNQRLPELLQSLELAGTLRTRSNPFKVTAGRFLCPKAIYFSPPPHGSA